MATAQSKKTGSSAGRNPDRRNGKAWKKKPKTKNPNKLRTPEAELRYVQILNARAARKNANIARRAEEKRLAEILAAKREADRLADLAAREALEIAMVEEQARKSRERAALKKIAKALVSQD